MTTSTSSMLKSKMKIFSESNYPEILQYRQAISHYEAYNKRLEHMINKIKEEMWNNNQEHPPMTHEESKLEDLRDQVKYAKKEKKRLGKEIDFIISTMQTNETSLKEQMLQSEIQILDKEVKQLRRKVRDLDTILFEQNKSITHLNLKYAAAHKYEATQKKI